MKTIKNILVTAAVFFLFSVQLSMAQAPPPPNNGGGDAGSGNTAVGGEAPGGSAPIGGGLLILVALGAGYGSKKVYNIKFKAKH